MGKCAAYLEILRERGYRITPQREMIVQVIAHGGEHMTAEEVFRQVRTRTRAVNLATVYRTLDLLVEEGLISRSDLGAGQIIYAAGWHGPHVHLVCRLCGYVTDVDIETFTPVFRGIEDAFGFSCGPQHFSIRGLCSGCRPADGCPANSSQEVER